ncbi:MAG: NERD domain-containing protein [Burkholderiales bacterium]|nr:NERD domain-containing protein [Burkholderiales bacterium]
MATLIPSIGACVSRMTSGEKRFAQRLETKLEEDYLCWYDVAVGERSQHPDFIVFHPQRGLLVLEVKDWKLDTIQQIDKQTCTLLTAQGNKEVLNPLEQARQYLYAIVNKLERDPQLIWPSGSLKGKPFFPYGHGLVLANISRKQFESTDLAEVLPAHLVMCQDEFTESVDAEEFQARFWQMFPLKFTMKLSLPQIDRVRWHIFPEIRIPDQGDLFAAADIESVELPDILRVMDIQQEQMARSLGEGHRVIHGVAGSGKTMILAYRAQYLAQLCQRPILILCYNKTLATKLTDVIAKQGLSQRVNVVNFHAWCVRQLGSYHVDKPPQSDDLNLYFEACVDRVIQGVERGQIPTAQYDAVLIDEGHDFKPEWFKLVVQMIHPDSNSLLVLYDDAQSIYGGAKKLKFSFSSVGIQAKGRTTILKLNYRNTAEIIAVARAFADTLLTQQDEVEDQAPTLHPMSTNRHGSKPLLVKLPSARAEYQYLLDRLVDENKTGRNWGEMAVLYRHYGTGKEMAALLKQRGIPHQWQQDKTRSFQPSSDSIKLITMHSSKGLEFPYVCIPAVGAQMKKDELIEDEARLLYVAMTRATEALVMTHRDEGALVQKMKVAMMVLEGV